METGRCEKHKPMMELVAAAWWGSTPETARLRISDAIYAESDGYGEPGLIPPQGYDWSGIRDSSPAAIERMFDVVKRALA
jgi:hypothetical protein